MNKIIEEDIKQIISENQNFEKLRNKHFGITGASGMIGSYILYTLIYLNESYDMNIDITAFVRTPEKLPEWVKDKCSVVKYDVIDPLNYDKRVDYLVHAASPASPKLMKDYPFETNLANTIGTYNTLKYALDSRAEKYMFVSSREIYGEPQGEQEFFYEDGPLGYIDHLIPRNGYAEGKKAAENMCMAAKVEYGLDVKVVRPAHTYGPGMSIYDGRVQADFLKNVVSNENIIMKSRGTKVRTYTYISDVISGMFKVLLDSKDVVYNIADESSKVSIRELAEVLVEIADNESVNLIMENRDEEKGVASFTGGIVSSDKIRNELGWKPKYSVYDGFKRTIEFINSESRKSNKYLKKKQI